MFRILILLRPQIPHRLTADRDDRGEILNYKINNNKMVITKKTIKTEGVKFYIEKDGVEVARTYLYILKNDLHNRPFGFMEDVFVDESLRGKGMGTELVNEVIKEAKINSCYKLVANSRHGRKKVHELYEKIGFDDWGTEFRVNLN